MQYVWILLSDDHRDDFKIEGVYATKERARAEFSKILINSYWDSQHPEEDEDGKTLDECVNDMTYAGWGDYLRVEEHEVDI